ncbi:shikimate kinase [Adlercreutzia murintestinalis]|uniref:shikimate kinase n=1 Tax=Adlercreutzia murintestinalis TaxID=2941325 RepID=UPI00203CD5C4|nr:shikimate kinase [Adlercreutzia murintestinalis]
MARRSGQSSPKRPHRLHRSVYLIGFMGAGKSTVARRLSRMCGLASIDMDSYIERLAGMPIPQIFEESGEEGFRRMETQALRDIAAMEPMVVSCGGGVVTRPENIALMSAHGTVVHLRVTADQAAARISDTSSRPLFQDLAAARARLEERLPAYEAAADLTIETGGRSVGAIAHEVRRALERRGVLERLDASSVA